MLLVMRVLSIVPLNFKVRVGERRDRGETQAQQARVNGGRLGTLFPLVRFRL